jgi:phosphatidylinositol phospholipase C delta
MKQERMSPQQPPLPVFRSALADVKVPACLLLGVVTVFVEMMGDPVAYKSHIFYMSEDKFTLYLERTTHKKCTNMSLTLPSLTFTKTATTNRETTTSDSASVNKEDSKEAIVIDIACIERVERGPVLASARSSGCNNARGNVRGTIASKFKIVGDKVASPVRRGEGHDFSLSVFHNATKRTNIWFDSEVTRDDILQGLLNVMEQYQIYKQQASKEVLLMRYLWRDVDKDHSETLDERELLSVMRKVSMNHKLTTDCKARLKMFAMKKMKWDKKKARSGYSFDQAVTFLYHMQNQARSGSSTSRHPIDKLWYELFGSDCTCATADDFHRIFLCGKQQERRVTLEQVHDLFTRINNMQFPQFECDPRIHAEPHKYIDRERFEAYVLSEQNDVYDPLQQHSTGSGLNADAACMDMNRPLSEYWINSSHNTYLTGDQLSSKSDAEMYTKALMRGCRCVEIDVWDGWDRVVNNIRQPVVYHGFTATSLVTFAEVVQAIRDFLDNRHTDGGEVCYPIILSIENHCRPKRQEIMARCLEDILGEYLYIPRSDQQHGPKDQLLPSPHQLRGKVVIKGRRPPLADMDTAIDRDDESDDEGDNTSKFQETTRNTVSDPLHNMEDLQSSCDGLSIATNDTHVCVNVSPALARLTLLHGNSFEDWATSLSHPSHFIHSFTEAKIEKFASKSELQRQCADYNRDHLSRVYPLGTRVNSENYSPVTAWSMGCQLVALNYQTSDDFLQINDGFFRQNNGCGYILKSPHLLRKGRNFHGIRKPVTFTVQILSGSCLPKPEGSKKGEMIDPYVETELFDVEANNAVSSKEASRANDPSRKVKLNALAGAASDIMRRRAYFKTSVVDNDGFAPVWHSSKPFEFVTENSNVAMLLLTLKDAESATKDDFIASAAIPVHCLRAGFRSVRLFSANNKRCSPFDFASLFVSIAYK